MYEYIHSNMLPHTYSQIHLYQLTKSCVNYQNESSHEKIQRKTKL